MIREKSNFVQKFNLCSNETFPNKKYYLVHDLESSLNSNKTFSFISLVVVLNFSNSCINRWYQLLVCGHNGLSNVSRILEEADFIERIYPVGSSGTVVLEQMKFMNVGS